LRFRNKITPTEKEKLIEELVKAGAIKREKTLTPGDAYYSSSLGEKGLKVLKIKI